jgi:hypothetical protein
MISRLVSPPAQFVDIDLARLVDHVIEPLKGHFDNIVVGIVYKAEKRQPFCLDLVAKGERHDLDFRLLGSKRLRDTIKVRPPSSLRAVITDLLFVKLRECPPPHSSSVSYGSMKMAAIDEVKVLDRCADTIEHLPLSKINGFEARSHPFPACWWERQQNTGRSLPNQLGVPK